jgi:hypothetical protein
MKRLRDDFAREVGRVRIFIGLIRVFEYILQRIRVRRERAWKQCGYSLEGESGDAHAEGSE